MMNPLPSESAGTRTIGPNPTGGINGLTVACRCRFTNFFAETFTTAPLVFSTTSPVTVRRRFTGGPSSASAAAEAATIITAANRQLHRIMLMLSHIGWCNFAAARHYISVGTVSSVTARKDRHAAVWTSDSLFPGHVILHWPRSGRSG